MTVHVTDGEPAVSCGVLVGFVDSSACAGAADEVPRGARRSHSQQGGSTGSEREDKFYLNLVYELVLVPLLLSINVLRQGFFLKYYSSSDTDSLRIYHRVFH